MSVKEVPDEQKRVIVKRNFEGMVQEGNFSIETAALSTDLHPGDVLVKNLFFSMDPYLRTLAAAKAGEIVTNFGVGIIAISRNESLVEGTYVTGILGWEQYTLVPDSKVNLAGNPLEGLTAVPQPTPRVPLSFHLGILGMPGATAYFGLLHIGEPEAGETVLVSSASGAVGQIVGQIAKLKGCRVVGSAGSKAKVQFLKNELAFDAAFNYNEVSDLDAELAKLCPDGIDVYFDNVGGAFLDAALKNMNKFGRVVGCGQISQYNNVKTDHGIKNLILIIPKSIKIQGFVVSDFSSEWHSFLHDTEQWLEQGKLKYVEHVTEGIENAPKAFVGIFSGANFGKSVIKIA